MRRALRAIPPMPLLLAAALLWSRAAAGQLHDGVWLMADDNTSVTTYIEGNVLDFRNGSLSVSTDSFFIELHSSVANICDADGQLLFYTNGCKIANAAHQLMENGDDINPGPVHELQCFREDYPWQGAYTAGYQSCLALPAPGSDSLYYLFHKGLVYEQDPQTGLNVLTQPLYYSLVNMAANGGLGRVEVKNVPIIDVDVQFGQLTAVRHANGIDWWVLSPGARGSNLYYRFRLSTEGVGPVQTQTVGAVHTRGGGWANFSPDGLRYARYNPANNDDVFLFTADRTTGELSNFVFIPIDEGVTYFNSGVAFSPNSRYLYVSSALKIFQFDTWADDIAASGVVVGEYEPTNEFIPEDFWGMQLGPDCRLYVYCNSCDVVHVIHRPDERGAACQFEQAAVSLPWGIFRSQPHFPNYRLGPLGQEGLPCTPVVSASEPPPPPGPELWVAPNPSAGWARVQGRALAPGPVRLQIIDAFGRPQASWTAWIAEGRLDEPLPMAQTLPPGLYWLLLQTAEGQTQVLKWIKH